MQLLSLSVLAAATSVLERKDASGALFLSRDTAHSPSEISAVCLAAREEGRRRGYKRNPSCKISFSVS